MAEATERLLVRIDATTEQLRRELKRADDAVTSTGDRIAMQFDKIKKKTSEVAVAATKWGAAMAAAGAAVTASLVKTGLQSVDSLAKTADKLGITTESLAQMRFAAEQTGVEVNKFDTALQRFTRRLGDAAAGSGPAVKAFDRLGLSAQELVKLSPDQAFLKVADAMQDVGNQTEKVSVAFKLFDSEGVGLVNTLDLGSEGLAELAAQADAAGLSISRIEAAKIEEANDAINRAAKVFEGFSSQLAVQFAPVIEDIANKMFSFGTGAVDSAGAANKAFEVIAKGAGFVGDAIRGIEIAVKAVGVGLQTFYVAQLKLLNNFVKALDALPLVDLKYSSSALDKYTDEMTKDLFDASRALKDLINAPLPSRKVENYFKDLNSELSDLAEIQTEAAERAKTFFRTLSDGQGSAEQLNEIVVTATRINNEYSATLQDVADETHAVTRAQDPFIDALEQTVSRIDAAFSEAWKGAFDSFKDFADGIKDAFKNLIAELAHMAITRPIIMSIGAAFGLGSSGSMASTMGSMGSAGNIFSSISGAGGIMPWLSGGVGGALGSIGGAYTAAGNFLGAGNVFGNAALSQGRLYQYGSIGQGIGSLGLNLGAGFAGNYLGGKVFGDTTGIGSAVGGIAGSIFGPLGTGIGSFLGSGIEKGLGNLLGFGSGGNNSAIGDFDFGAGSLVSRGVGKNFSERNLQAVQQIEQTLAQFAETLGGTDAAFRVRVGNKSGFKLDGERFDDASELIAEGFKRIAEGATDLSPELKKLIKAFDGTAEETATYAAAIVNISKVVERNPVVDAVDDFSKQLELAGMTTRRVYDEQINAIEDMAMAFDGSLESTQALSQALSMNKSMAYELAIALQQVNQTIQGMVADQILFFKQQTMSDDQLLKDYEQAFSFLWGGLSQQTDPAKIREIGEGLLWLNRELFNMGSPELQQANADFFIDRAKAIEEATGATIFRAGLELQASQDDLNTKMQVMLSQASEGFNTSANTMQTAAQIFMEAVQYFTGNATGQYQEVTA